MENLKKLTAFDALDDCVVMVFCVGWCSWTNEWIVGDTCWLWFDIILCFNYEFQWIYIVNMFMIEWGFDVTAVGVNTYIGKNHYLKLLEYCSIVGGVNSYNE